MSAAKASRNPEAAGLAALRTAAAESASPGGLSSHLGVVRDSPESANWRAKTTPGTRWGIRLACSGGPPEQHGPLARLRSVGALRAAAGRRELTADGQAA